MSYPHLRRIYFGGLSYTNPGTINNYAVSYAVADVTLTKDHRYRIDDANGDGGPSGYRLTLTPDVPSKTVELKAP